MNYIGIITARKRRREVKEAKNSHLNAYIKNIKGVKEGNSKVNSDINKDKFFNELNWQLKSNITANPT